MKIYFVCSPAGISDYGEFYNKIYTMVEKSGHSHVGDFNTEISSVVVNRVDEDLDVKKLHDRTMEDLKKADICIFETSSKSLATGHLIGLALDMGKPVIALYTDSKKPLFLSGIDNDKLQVVEYNEENLEESLKSALDYAQEQSDVRFNFFISPAIGHYLDWVAKNKKIPRSVYLRNLIEKDMANNEDYQ